MNIQVSYKMAAVLDFENSIDLQVKPNQVRKCINENASKRSMTLCFHLETYSTSILYVNFKATDDHLIQACSFQLKQTR